MKAIEITFIVPDDEVDALEHELRDSQLLENWPIVSWEIRETKLWEDKWYKEEYKPDV
jgi:hypothetical protein